MKNLNYLKLKKLNSINDFNHFANKMTTMKKYYTHCRNARKETLIPSSEEIVKQYKIANNERI